VHRTRHDLPPASVDGAHPTALATALETIAERLRSDVARAVRKICPRWLSDHADDLAQIATARVLERAIATDGQTEFSQGYVYRTVHSVLVDEIRKRRRLREVSMEPGHERVATSPRGNPEGNARRVELRDAIRRCLAKLLESRRRAVMLHLQGHSVVETGSLLACDRRKAENLTYRGLADLRSCLSSQGIEP
jgi:RNA polymerase sigma-70 factor, ECF subfamily